MKVHERSYSECDWLLRSPVRASTFVAQRPELAPFNVQIDLGAIPPFEDGTRLEDSELLYSDMQTIGAQGPLRLGSGRAGFYRGRYIKGIGRTALAGNWAVTTDRTHATGALKASGAMREFIVTRYLEAKGAGHLINGCEGVLLRPSHPELATLEWCALPCDQAIQAITVKDAKFARFSNFSWWMNHLNYFHGAHDIFRFFMRFAMFLRPQEEIAEGDVTPEWIVEMLDRTVSETFDRFMDYWELGVMWLAGYNNTTMDGRFHDLDCPIIFGGPFVGTLCSEPAEAESVTYPSNHRVFGLEILDVIHCTRVFCRSLLHKLHFLLDGDFRMPPAAREFMAETAAALQKMTRESLLFSDRLIRERIVSRMVRTCAFGSAEEKLIGELVAISLASRISHTKVEGPLAVPCRPVPFTLAHTDPFNRSAFMFAGAPSARAIEEAGSVNELLSRLDHERDVDRLLQASMDAAAWIAQHITPTSRPGAAGAGAPPR